MAIVSYLFILIEMACKRCGRREDESRECLSSPQLYHLIFSSFSTRFPLKEIFFSLSLFTDCLQILIGIPKKMKLKKLKIYIYINLIRFKFCILSQQIIYIETGFILVCSSNGTSLCKVMILLPSFQIEQYITIFGAVFLTFKKIDSKT